MRSWLSAIAIVSAVTGCSLVVSLDELRGSDASPPADAAPEVAPDVATPDATPDSSPDAGGLNPVASWTFDEDGGTTAHDVTGHGHDGVISGGTWVAGHSGSALLLNGTNQFVTVPASSAFDKHQGGSFSITAWIQRVGTFSHDLVLSVSYGSFQMAYALEAQSNTLMNYWDGLNHIATSTAPFVVSEWHHAAIVIDGGILAHTYFDGSQVGTGTADDTARACTAVLIGSSNFGDYLPGAIDNVRFYDRALSLQEIQTDMSQ